MKPPEQLALEEEARKLARKLREDLPPGVGFTLLMFTEGAGGYLAYMSTAERRSMIATMREFIRKAEVS